MQHLYHGSYIKCFIIILRSNDAALIPCFLYQMFYQYTPRKWCSTHSMIPILDVLSLYIAQMVPILDGWSLFDTQHHMWIFSFS